jgi:hypothetical protein
MRIAGGFLFVGDIQVRKAVVKFEFLLDGNLAVA